MPKIPLILLLLALVGCQSTRDFAAPASGWRTYQGQLRYAGEGKPIIGEVVVRTGADSHFELELLGGPGFPLMRTRSDATRGFAEGAIARGRWSGPVEKVPPGIAGWFILDEAFTAAEGKSGSISGGGWTATVERSGKKLTGLDIRIAASGERFTFHFGE